MIRAVVLPLAILFAASLATAQTNPQVVMKTSKGDIVIELDAAKAPVTVKNLCRRQVL
jgi:peptidyl-prolyl cis-trans isomerase A (cyclophilin A)